MRLLSPLRPLHPPVVAATAHIPRLRRQRPVAAAITNTIMDRLSTTMSITITRTIIITRMMSQPTTAA